MNEQPANPTGSTQPPDSNVRRSPSRRRQVLTGAALATGLVLGGTAVAAGASNTATIQRTADAGVRAAQNGAAAGFGAAEGPRDGRPGGHMSGGMRGGTGGGVHGGMRGALHGELTVPQADGTGTEVILVQRGTVTAVSSTSLSVKSTDGFTSTYTVSSSTLVRTADGTTIGGVKVGATVHVVSTKAKAALMVGGDHMGGRPGDHMGGRLGDQLRPTPSPSATSST